MALTQLITLFLLQTQDSPKTCTMFPEAIIQTLLVLWQVWCHVHFSGEHVPLHNHPSGGEANQDSPNTPR